MDSVPLKTKLNLFNSALFTSTTLLISISMFFTSLSDIINMKIILLMSVVILIVLLFFLCKKAFYSCVRKMRKKRSIDTIFKYLNIDVSLDRSTMEKQWIDICEALFMKYKALGTYFSGQDNLWFRRSLIINAIERAILESHYFTGNYAEVTDDDVKLIDTLKDVFGNRF